MTTALFMLSGIALIGVMVAVYDWLSRRGDDKSRRA